MTPYCKMSKEELKAEQSVLLKQYNDFKSLNLSLDMSRGKPGKEQLDLSMKMLDVLTSKDNLLTENNFDTRNYGLLDGIEENKKLFAEILDVPAKNIIVGGNSSLNLMYDSVARSMSFGVCGSTPWCKLNKVKFLCPVPGYDRHFAITELFGIEMIPVKMTKDGPDMETVKKYVESDETVKGIWCVPKYSNPDGITYSDETVKAFAALKPKAEDFRIYWDNAYCVHDLTDTPDILLNIFDACKETGNEDIVLEFASTSKISFSGSGVAVVAASDKNIESIKKLMSIQTIGFDKINQLRHVRFFKNKAGVIEHMKKHSALVAPKFNAVINALDKEIAPLEIASYIRPNGGYFISFFTQKGCAKRVVSLCKEAGVTLTSAGATYPYGNDPDDANIRIAPSFPSVEELNKAMELFCICVKLATLEKMLSE